MLKLIPSEQKAFHDFKCGEIYCVTATIYSVNCCICGEKVTFEDFPKHFQEFHLTQERRDDKKDSLEKGETFLSFKPGINSPDDFDIKSEYDFGVEESDTDVSEFQSLEEEKPIEFLEVRLPKLDKRRTRSFIPEDNVTNSDIEDGELNGEIKSSSLPKKNQTLKTIITSEEEKTRTAALETSEKKPSKTVAIKKNTEQEGSSCPICNRFYKLKRSLQQHIRNIHRAKKGNPDNKCTECGEQFSNLRELRLHMTNHISCDICGKSFTTEGNMKTHRKRHTGVRAYRCNECESSFYSKRELNSHMLRHTQKMPYMCEVCGRPCRDKAYLKGHMRRHTGERPAKCNVCGKCFFSNFDLNVHSVTHTTERPFACSICLSTFQTKKALRVHKKLHSSERRHECKVCHKTFAQAGALNTHMARGHTLEDQSFQLHDLIINNAQF